MLFRSVVVSSIGYAQPRQFATELFNHWGIGKKGKDNGLLVLFVLDQRDITFETGYGMEGILPDAICKRIQMQAMLPAFKEGDYDAGMLAGIKRIVSIVKEEPQEEIVIKETNWQKALPITLAIYLLSSLLTFLWVNRAVRKTKANKQLKTNLTRYSHLKKQTSLIILTVSVLSFFISPFVVTVLESAMPLLMIVLIPFTTSQYAKIMRNRIRRAPIPCDACGSEMRYLSEKEEDEYLSLAQQFEEQLHAVDYDVFLCDACKNESITWLDKTNSYQACPQCYTKAFRLESKKTILAPTYINSGTQRITHKCKFCGFSEQKNKKIPRLTRSSTSSGGGISSGSGGFSSSSGGSFGGGSSGGGGASSRW